MFDIGFIEMLVVGLILLLVVGPERLPEVARTLGGWMHQAKQYMDSVKGELDRDLRLEELDRETRQSISDLDRQTRESLDEAGREARQGFEDLDQETRRQTDLSAGAEGGKESGEEGPGEESGTGTGESAEGGGSGDRGADPEDQAAADLERELEKDDNQGLDGERRG